MMIGFLAQKSRRERHARSCADAHIDAANKNELLDFWAWAIDADRRRVVVSGTARNRVDQRLNNKWGEFAGHGFTASKARTACFRSIHAAATWLRHAIMS